MSGICGCPECGEFYYGDERDDWQTCSCSPPTPPEESARLREEYEREEAEDRYIDVPLIIHATLSLDTWDPEYQEGLTFAKVRDAMKTSDPRVTIQYVVVGKIEE